MDKLLLNNLITLSLKNDYKAFREIVEAYQLSVYSLVFKLLNNEQDAKDVVQETFIKVWLNLEKYNADKKFINWLYKIATNLCMDKLRSLKYSENLENNISTLIASDNAEQKMIDEEFEKTVRFLVNGLTPKQKIVFTLHCVDGLEIKEIIEITGMTSAKIKSNLFLARKHIRTKLAHYEK
ncbi:MAG: sigma-70 family RNA polymerase sigma factor [Bacteroidales bacterium]|jgi:RNA polymerase sigma-70 factor (ECF subfamily)|nr:sigma-70 family RNA polymerase sigma factor [Bacteroidales bacterium]